MAVCKVTFGFRGDKHSPPRENSILFRSLSEGAIGAMKIAHVLGLRPCSDMGVSKKNPIRRVESISHYVEVTHIN